MKKKMVSILTAAFCASALLAGCGSADTAKTSASSAGAASSSADGTTTFTVGFDAEYPPYGYMDDETGDYTGFDLELCRGSLRDLRLEAGKNPDQLGCERYRAEFWCD